MDVFRTNWFRTTALVALAALLATAGWGALGEPPASQAQGDQRPPAARALAGRIQALVNEAGLGDRVGVSVVDARSGAEIAGVHENLALNPASNMKLVTAAGALFELGPDFTMLTGLYGEIEEDGVVRQLSLRGFGDPTLRMSDLVELAEQLADRGVQRVEHVIVDGSYFDDQFLPPAFEQQPDEVASFRAAVGAVSVERNAYELRIVPGTAEGDPARVRLAAEGYFDLENEITTGGRLNVIAIQRDLEGRQLDLKLRGSIPAGILGVSYRRRIERPLPYAGHSMVEALRRAGIRTTGRVAIRDTPEGAPLLTSRRSQPVSELLGVMGKWSDNFTAEMMLKVIGAEASRPGTTERGCQVLTDLLARAGATPDELAIVNGSGLFDGNELAASHLTKLLVHVYNDEAIRPEFLSHLAIGGEEGTLRRRLKDLPAPRIVRAKTGTLAGVIALSGYVTGPEPGQAIAFSFLANDVRGKHGPARALADDIVRAIADTLHE